MSWPPQNVGGGGEGSGEQGGKTEWGAPSPPLQLCPSCLHPALLSRWVLVRFLFGCRAGITWGQARANQIRIPGWHLGLGVFQKLTGVSRLSGVSGSSPEGSGVLKDRVYRISWAGTGQSEGRDHPSSLHSGPQGPTET